MRIAVTGATGKMGVAICEALDASAHDVVARLGSANDVTELAGVGAHVLVDVTNAEAARRNVPAAAEMKMNAVVGTTGFDQKDLATFEAAFRAVGKTCFLVPNFSIGAVLMMQFAEKAAPYFDGVEVIELHHPQKKDAPSGTAALTAGRVAAARTEPWSGPANDERSGQVVDGIRIHSVRLPGLLAHQEVIFGSTGQTLTIRHDSYDRSAFMPGVLKAVDGVESLPVGVVTGLDAIL